MIKILIFGAGNTTEKIFKEIHDLLRQEVEIIGFIDNNIQLNNLSFFGKRIYLPNEIKNLKWDFIVICSIYEEEIRKQLIEEYHISADKIKSTNFLGGVCELGKIDVIIYCNENTKDYMLDIPEKINVVDTIINERHTLDESSLKYKFQKGNYRYIVVLDENYEKEYDYLSALGVEESILNNTDLIVKYKLEAKYKNTVNENEKRMLDNVKLHKELRSYYFSYKTECYFVKFDDELPYIVWNDKKLYFPKDTRFFYQGNRAFLTDPYIEQHKECAHKYEYENVLVEQDDILLDIGACEGNFSLYNIEKLKKVYLIESERKWCEALKKTFAPWKDKVCIINSFIADRNVEGKMQYKIDTLFPNEYFDFVKMDIEGGEIMALRGMDEIMKKKRIRKYSICSYHKSVDKKTILDIFNRYKINGFCSEKLMITQPWFDHEMYISPDFRTGVVYGHI